MNKFKFSALLGALAMMMGCVGCVADGSYYGGGGYGPGYYGGGYGPGYYGAPGPVVVAGGPVYRETVVVDNNRYRYRDGYYRGRRPSPYYSGYRRGGNGYSSRRGPGVTERRGVSRRTPGVVNRRGNDKKRRSNTY